jgi:hypothetical protein
MSRERSRRQRSAGDLFEVTPRPFLRSFTRIETEAGRVDRGWVREEASITADLNQQEFLLFRGLRSEAEVATFARSYGLLELAPVTGQLVRVRPNLRPVWARALTMEPDRYRPGAEPVVDWLRQAGLMDLALGLWGLLRGPRSRPALIAACHRLRSGPERPSLAAQGALAATSSSWPVRSTLGGAAAAGLSLAGAGAARVGARGSLAHVEFVPSKWRPVVRNRRRLRQPVRLELSTEGIAELLAGRFLNPWLERMGPSLAIRRNEIAAGFVSCGSSSPTPCSRASILGCAPGSGARARLNDPGCSCGDGGRQGAGSATATPCTAIPGASTRPRWTVPATARRPGGDDVSEPEDVDVAARGRMARRVDRTSTVKFVPRMC